MSCFDDAVKEHVVRLDSNADDKPDIVQTFKGTQKIKESIDYLGGIYKSVTYYWNDSGILEKSETAYRSHAPFITYYKNEFMQEMIGGRPLRRFEVDAKRTYKGVAEDAWIKSYKGQKYIYVTDDEQQRIAYAALDALNEGRFNYVALYDDYGRIAKSYEDKDKDGIFDEMRVFNNGALVKTVAIEISVDTLFSDL